MRARFTKAVAAAAALAFLSAGCASVQENPKSTLGGLGGAAAGGLIAAGAGGNTAAIVGGVLLGGLLGGAVGNALAQLALENSRTGQVSTWSNPDSGNSGSFTPTRTYQEPSGRYCREYTEEIWVAGERQQAYGTACREPDGSWRVQQ
jgi:surface antigen